MLEIIHAGAGSGKTHTLCEIAVQRIVAGMRPERLMATTFTRRAAAELKQRIASALLSCDELSSSQRRVRVSQLDGALIGTIHSVAHALVTRHAFVLGVSPRVGVIDEAVAADRLREVLGSEASETWEALSETARQLSIDQPESLILRLLAAKRENRIDDDSFRCQMRASAERVGAVCGDGRSADTPAPFEHLDRLLRQTQRELESHVDDTKVTEQARVELRRLAHHPSRQWRTFVDAAKLNAGKRSGADALLDPLRRFAANVRCERQLHETIIKFVDMVSDETLRLDHAYAESKRTSAAVDFVDLECLFLQLIESEALRRQLRSDIELVLVDEFQDVSPLQLAIFSRLRSIVRHSHWVGDEKQAIYGFRGSDPELVRRHWNHPQSGKSESVAPVSQFKIRQLPKNYRSAAGLVALSGELFAEPLGEEARQTPVRSDPVEGDAGRVERWVFESKNVATDLQRLASGIAGLIEEGARAGEIAVLARSNPRLKAIAVELQQQGIGSRLAQPGLMRTREAALLVAGLRMVADRFDSLAAATICHLLSDPDDATPGWLADRLREVGCSTDHREGSEEANASDEGEEPPRWPWDGHVLLNRLRQIDPRGASPTCIAAEVIEALHLGKHIRRWGTPGRRASHIDTVLEFAEGYEETAADTGETATLAGLIHHLERLAETEQDVREPPADSDAVTLLTYHGAKGLEFPTVVLFDLDHDRQAEPWEVTVEGGGGAEDPTHGRTLRYWPWPFGRNPRTGALLSGTGVEVSARQSAEGQEAARMAREESVRLLYVGFTRARDRLVLAHRVGQSAWLNQLPSVDRWLPLEEEAWGRFSTCQSTAPAGCKPTPRGSDSAMSTGCKPAPREAAKWEYRVRRLTEATGVSAVADIGANWFDPGRPLRRSRARGAAWHAPSRQRGADGELRIRIEATGAAAYFPAARDREQFRRIGDSVHAYLAALPSLRGCDETVRIQCATRCVDRYRTDPWLSPRWMVEAGERLRQWVHRQWPDAHWMCEMPFTADRKEGGRWRGIADAILEIGDGGVVIIDHKSTPLRVEDCEGAAASHSGQLAATREALTEAGLRVAAACVHFPLAGRMATVVGPIAPSRNEVVRFSGPLSPE